jgi:hypothetical protein
VRRLLDSAIDEGYLERTTRGHSIGRRSTACASEYRLTLPVSQPDTVNRTPNTLNRTLRHSQPDIAGVSTGHQMSTLQSASLSGVTPSERASQPASGRPAKWRQWCGDSACRPETSRLEDPETGQDLGRCPACHPAVVPRRSRGAA